jgi:hypothetical protein
MMNITDAMTDDDEDDHYWLSEEDNANIVADERLGSYS